MTDKELRERIGITVAELNVLAIAAEDPHGRATGPLFGIATKPPRLALRRDGMLREQDFGADTITPMGRDVVALARELAWRNLLGEGIER